MLKSLLAILLGMAFTSTATAQRQPSTARSSVSTGSTRSSSNTRAARSSLSAPPVITNTSVNTIPTNTNVNTIPVREMASDSVSLANFTSLEERVKELQSKLERLELGLAIAENNITVHRLTIEDIGLRVAHVEATQQQREIKLIKEEVMVQGQDGIQKNRAEMIRFSVQPFKLYSQECLVRQSGCLSDNLNVSYNNIAGRSLDSACLDRWLLTRASQNCFFGCEIGFTLIDGNCMKN